MLINHCRVNERVMLDEIWIDIIFIARINHHMAAKRRKKNFGALNFDMFNDKNRNSD
jgi:hypothetical protein